MVSSSAVQLPTGDAWRCSQSSYTPVTSCARRCQAPGAESTRKAATPLLPPLLALLKRDMAKCSARQLGGAAQALADLQALDAATARAVDARFCRLVLPRQSNSALRLADVGALLAACDEAEYCPSRELLTRVRDWVVAAGLRASKAARKVAANPGLGLVMGQAASKDGPDPGLGQGPVTSQAGRHGAQPDPNPKPGLGQRLGPPAAAARVLQWAARHWKDAIPMPAVWALARGAVGAASAAEDGRGAVGLRNARSTLHALACLVSKGQPHRGVAAAGYGVPSDLQGDIARLGSWVVRSSLPGDAAACHRGPAMGQEASRDTTNPRPKPETKLGEASRDLALALWSLHELGVAPDAATAAAAAAGVAAAAQTLEGTDLLMFASQVSPALVAWHRLGLVPDLGPAARLLAARMAELAREGDRDLGLYVKALKPLMSAARLPMPRALHKRLPQLARRKGRGA